MPSSLPAPSLPREASPHPLCRGRRRRPRHRRGIIPAHLALFWRLGEDGCLSSRVPTCSQADQQHLEQKHAAWPVSFAGIAGRVDNHVNSMPSRTNRSVPNWSECGTVRRSAASHSRLRPTRRSVASRPRRRLARLPTAGRKRRRPTRRFAGWRSIGRTARRKWAMKNYGRVHPQQSPHWGGGEVTRSRGRRDVRLNLNPVTTHSDASPGCARPDPLRLTLCA